LKLNLKELATKVFQIESIAIFELARKLDDNFENSVKAIFNTKGKTIITGMGKSGIIGKKIAATLASTGTPSFFVHPGEAYHGDLGMIEKEDVVIMISNSGETDEALKLIPFLTKRGNIFISMTGNKNSTLAKYSNFHLDISVEEEACPLKLAPTSSTTATLAMGDALAVALIEMRQFQPKDFAEFHPGGSLGKRLLTTIQDIMRTKDLPTTTPKTNIKDVIHTVSSGKLGLAIVLNEKKHILGIITDGDIRRAMEENQEKFFDLNAENIMTLSPKTIKIDEKATLAEEIMSKNQIDALIVTDHDNCLAGVLKQYDIGNI
jgi:arabinose-5-phosphate isomerase